MRQSSTFNGLLVPHTAGRMNGHTEGNASDMGALTGTMRVKVGLAQMLKGGVIMGKGQDIVEP